jgi:hypothetical protein
MPQPAAPPAAVWSDLAPILDEELARLPDVLRLPVVLCDLEGRPQREAARQLGVPVTTLVTRLAKARRTLAVRLSGRGVTLSGGALAGVLTAHASAAAVPAPLSIAAVATASAISAGGPAAVPAAVQFLSEGVLRMILVSKLKAVSASAVAVAGLALGLAAATVPSARGQSAPADPPAQQPLNTARSLDDTAFLRRACVDLRGTPPTDLEHALFRTDDDPKKRTKVVEWLLSDGPGKPVNAVTANVANLNSRYPLGLRVTTQPNTSSTLGSQTSTTLNSNLTNLNTTLNGSTSLPNQDLSNFLVGQTTIQHTVDFYEKAYFTQTQSVRKADEPDTAKLKQDIAAMKAKLDKLETEYQVKQKQAEKARQDDAVKEKLTKELNDLTAKMKALEKDNQKLLERKTQAEAAQTRQSAAEALLKLATAQEKLQADRLTREKLDKLRAEKAVQEKVLAEKLAQEKQRAMYELTLNESRRVLGERIGLSGDAAFLQRVVKMAYGVPATALELKYFAEDKDPKKREKLVDLILADPAVAKKLGPNGKSQLLSEPDRVTKTASATTGTVLESIYTVRSRAADPFAKLLEQVLDGKRTDEQVADAVTLATVGRYPTESEQKMMLASVTGAADRRVAWKKVLDTLAGTKEAQAHAESLQKK